MTEAATAKPTFDSEVHEYGKVWTETLVQVTQMAIARGEVVVVDGNHGLRMLKIVTPPRMTEGMIVSQELRSAIAR